MSMSRYFGDEGRRVLIEVLVYLQDTRRIPHEETFVRHSSLNAFIGFINSIHHYVIVLKWNPPIALA